MMSRRLVHRPVALYRVALYRVTMYRLVTIVLLALVLVALTMASVEKLDPSIFAPGDMLLTALVLVIASVASGRLFALIWRARPHTESAIITALLLWFLYWPASDGPTLAWLAAAAVLASASKYVIAWRGRHLLNPAAAGAVALFLVGEVLTGRVESTPPATTWWVASEPLLAFVVGGALLVLIRTGRIGMAVMFVFPAAAFTFWGVADFYPETGQALDYVAYSTPLVFFAGFMLSEPLTSAPRRWQQSTLALVAAIVFSWPLISQRLFGDAVHVGPFENTYEIALLVVNVIAFTLGQRGSVRLRFETRQAKGGDVWELTFRPQRPTRFRAGQYLELDLPHRPDQRGTRRMFTIASAPGSDRLALGVRLTEPGSSFKRALADLRPGDVVRATGVHGDFVWPAEPRPLLLVAGGIGVTPFLSQLRSGLEHDAVLVYGVPSAADIPYRDELESLGVPVVLVAPDAPVALPSHWRHVATDRVTAAVVIASVADAAERRVFVSGPPAMVGPLSRALRRRRMRVRTDSFAGY